MYQIETKRRGDFTFTLSYSPLKLVLSPACTGVFSEAVEWCLVVTTVVEIYLCALVNTQPQGPAAAATTGVSAPNFRLVPTSFTLPTDGVRIHSVTGTESGRIFLGGEDGKLYEMTYEGRIPQSYLDSDSNPMGLDLPLDEYLDKFYDEGKPVSSVITTDSRGIVTSKFSASALGERVYRSFKSLGTSGDIVTNGEQPRKCRKLNQTSHASSLVRALLPDFVTSSFLFKTSTSGGKIVQTVVDEHRKTIYTLSAKGWICAFDFRPPGLRLASVMDAPKTAQLYLEAISRGQHRVTLFSATLGDFHFPGETSAAAQAGVGGMDGARAILKVALDNPVKNGNKRDGNRFLRPVSIHVVEPSESSRLTLVAVTSGGLRLYISSLATSIIKSGFPSVQSSSALAPASRMTLCHIRSPPPSEPSSMEDAPYAGGMAPRLARTAPGRVDASWYKRGMFVTAIEPPASSSQRAARSSDRGRNEQTPVGDALVAINPDSVARKFVETSSSSIARDRKERLQIPGGIAEAFSTPMSSAYGSQVKDNAIVQGGLIWEIAAIPEDDSPLRRLAFNSQTPTDSELGVGLPPAYFPPSQVRSDYTTSSALQESSSRALVAHVPSLGSTALSLAGTMLSKFLFSGPARTGLVASRIPEDQFCYRISQRDGSQGFSLTAGETPTRRLATPSRSAKSPARTSPATKSARLRPWLLQPSAVPLNNLTAQHLSSATEIVLINAGGLQYFQTSTLLENLADAIVSAGENSGRDANVTKFFTCYGYKEGCAMCLALAVGCGPASGNSEYCQRVRRMAMDAALLRAFVPKLILRSDTQNGDSGALFGSLSPSRDPLVPPGYDFKQSALSEALTITFCRLVRPVWYKPAVVVTEGPFVRRQWMADSQILPAKVEVLIDETTVEEICRPLRNLIVVLKTKLSRAIKSVPGVPTTRDNAMDVDTDNDGNQYLIQAMQYQSHGKAGPSGSDPQLSALEAENIAHLIEEKNIHSLFRLLSRVVQLLDLITLLRRAHASTELREVNWGLLHGLTVSQLVQTPEGQDRLETLLNTLVTASASEQSVSVHLSAQADQLAKLFAEQCYLFFSPGSRYAYLGLRQGSRALACHTSSSLRSQLVRETGEYFRQAAQHWYSAPLITGRILHKRGEESYSQIAERAMQYGSPLASAVDLLIRLEDVVSAVEICLVVAANFKRTTTARDNQTTTFGQAHTYELDWEQNLYHKKRDLSGTLTTGGSNGSVSTPSHTQIAYGVEVTSQDAIETCYALIFHHVALLLNTNNTSLAFDMVAECAGASDNEFLSAFFLHLLNSGNAATLMKINSRELEKWLKNRDDTDLLWKYYNVQGRHREAGQVLWQKASDVTSNLKIGDRIDYLLKAKNSLKVALEEEVKTARYGVGDDGELDQRLKEVENSLQVARIQNRILNTVEANGDDIKFEISEDKVERLRTTLVQVSDLYNEYAVVLGLYEDCLEIFHVCRHDDSQAIQILWKNIISKEILPCSTHIEKNYSALKNLAGEIGRDNDVLGPMQAGDDSSIPVFENGDWIQSVEGKVISLGEKLYGKGADYVFPVHFLLLQLEGEYFCIFLDC